MRNKPSLYSFIQPILFILLIFGNHTFSQQTNDSLYIGRVCKIVLYNGFEATGPITYMTADSLRIKSEIKEHKIVIKDIKYVLKPGEDVSLKEEAEIMINEKKFTETLPPGISSECDVYLDDRTILKDVNLIEHSDTSLYAVKELGKREVLYSDIRKIVFKPSAPFWKGYLGGSIVGFFIGFVPFAFSKGGGHPDFSGPE
jgi:hypothetical protein